MLTKISFHDFFSLFSVFFVGDYLPSVRVHQPHRIVGAVRVRRQSRVLVGQRVHTQPDGEGGVVVPFRGGVCESGAGNGKVGGHGGVLR